MHELIVYVGIGFIVPAFLSLLLSYKSNQDKGRLIYDACHTGMFGSLIVLLIQVQLQNSQLSITLAKFRTDNWFSELATLKDSHKNFGFRSALIKLNDQMERSAENAVNGEIRYDENGTTLVWSDMFREANTSILATNYISEDFWSNDVQFNGLQRVAHLEAQKNGVNVRRIFILDETTDHEKLESLVAEQAQFGVDFKFIRLAEFVDSSAYLETRNPLGGAIDFVIYDLSTALIVTNDSSRNISGSILTEIRPKIDAGIALFNYLWTIASDDLQK